jgi:DNA-binding CsgD family transcriptional regulator
LLVWVGFIDTEAGMARRRVALLTKRELQVLAFVGSGMSDVEIANRLGISSRTVSSHVSMIIVRLDAKNRTHAYALALQQRLLSQDA